MYELVIDDISAMFGLGVYLKGEAAGQLKKMYQRLGVKYHFLDHFFAGVNLRFFDFGKADRHGI